jgi:hypothetical protein
MEIKCQLDATEAFYLQILLLAQYISGTTMPLSGAQEYYTVFAALGISCCKNVKSNF